MDTLNKELAREAEYAPPPMLDLAQLERLVNEDERHTFDGECCVHEGCRQI